MINDWKLVLKVILGSVALMLVVIWGLSRMGTASTTLSTDSVQLLNGATLIKENGETKVTVVVFSDMECPACKRADELMNDLKDMNGVKIVFRHFPLNIHKYSLVTAKAVEAARVMGKGWEMIDLLFDKQDEWSSDPKIENKLTEYAKELGLDEKIFIENLNSASVSAAVTLDLNLGNSLRLPGTPTIFVNGEQVSSDFVVAKVTELLKQ